MMSYCATPVVYETDCAHQAQSSEQMPERALMMEQVSRRLPVKCRRMASAAAHKVSRSAWRYSAKASSRSISPPESTRCFSCSMSITDRLKNKPGKEFVPSTEQTPSRAYTWLGAGWRLAGNRSEELLLKLVSRRSFPLPAGRVAREFLPVRSSRRR